jgi:argininosuccinate synthase
LEKHFKQIKKEIMKNNKVILAFSGGLDTTYCAIYLAKIKNLEVHAVLVNTGGFSAEEVSKIEQHAQNLGVASFVCVDEIDNFYNSTVKYLIYGNVLKNNTYPLSVSAERIAQAMVIAKHAKTLDASYIAHGSTGAGNDQVRFDMVFNIMVPELEIITPIRDMKLSREAEIEFLKSHGVNMNFEKNKYSINKGIWGTSVGGVETLTSHQALPSEAYPSQLTATEPTQITLNFEKGELVGLNDEIFEKPSLVIQKLNDIASAYAIGRDVHVGDTIIGIKGRVGFEAAAPVVIIKAHHLLEKHCLTKWQLYWKEQLAGFYGNFLHEGQFLDPLMRNIETFLEDTQSHVTGKVFVQLMPYNFQLIGIESSFDLMSDKFGTYGEMNNTWSGDDVKGFTKIFGNQVSIYQKIKEYNQA